MSENLKKYVPATPAEIVGLFLLLASFLAAFWSSRFGTLDYPFPQWDKLVHTVAGASLALVFYPHVKGRRLILLVLLIGFLFEVVEGGISAPVLYGGIRPYLLDTGLDLIVDALGAWIVVLGYRRYAK